MNGTSPLQFDIDSIREIARLVRESELGEICLETTDENEAPARLKIKRAAPPPMMFAPAAPVEAAAPSDLSSSSAPPRGDESTLGTEQDSQEDAGPPVFEIHAHVVGVFRSAPVPVEVGDELQAHQILGSVESLRVPNEVVASSVGRVVDVLVNEGQGVEYGQPLFVIEEI